MLILQEFAGYLTLRHYAKQFRIMTQSKYNESLTVKFTNLTKRQKETLLQMFAYMQKCTAAGANRRISFFWDAGWGIKSEILFSDSDEPKNCKVPIDIETNKEVFFDLSEGTITSYSDVALVDTTPLHAKHVCARKESNENS